LHTRKSIKLSQNEFSSGAPPGVGDATLKNAIQTVAVKRNFAKHKKGDELFLLFTQTPQILRK